MLDPVFTLDEISQNLRIPVEALMVEVSSGRLPAMKVAGHLRIAATDFEKFKYQAKGAPVPSPSGRLSSSDGNLQMLPVPDFPHKWPDGSVEVFGHAVECIAKHMGRDHKIKIGFAKRVAAGKERARGLVLVDRYPTVEFVGSDAELEGDGQIASVIKDHRKKHLPLDAELPSEYLGLPVGPYRSIVDGPGAAHSTAVICGLKDFEIMVKHALIRYSYSQARP